VARDPAGNSSSASVAVTVKDVTLPTVSVTSPSSGSQIVGVLTVTASASDNIGVAGVTFYWGATALGPEDTVAPYSVSAPTTYAQNGSVTLTAVARDTSGNTRTSTSVVVTINNPRPDTTNPVVAISTPASGATLSKTVTITAIATDNVKVVGVLFKVDGIALGAEDTTSPYSVSWNTTAVSNGTHVIAATARDAAGNAATSSLTVSVLNLPPETKYPTAYSVTTGVYRTGTLQSFVSDDDNYFTVGSTSSGTTRSSQTELQFSGITAPLSRIDLRLVLKSSASRTNLNIYVYDVSTSGWRQLTALTAGTSETTTSLAITSNLAAYVSPAGSMRVLVESRISTTHSLSLDLARVVVTH
jgi:hypothetical protein